MWSVHFSHVTTSSEVKLVRNIMADSWTIRTESSDNMCNHLEAIRHSLSSNFQFNAAWSGLKRVLLARETEIAPLKEQIRKVQPHNLWRAGLFCPLDCHLHSQRGHTARWPRPIIGIFFNLYYSSWDTRFPRFSQAYLVICVKGLLKSYCRVIVKQAE